MEKNECAARSRVLKDKICNCNKRIKELESQIEYFLRLLSNDQDYRTKCFKAKTRKLRILLVMMVCILVSAEIGGFIIITKIPHTPLEMDLAVILGISLALTPCLLIFEYVSRIQMKKKEHFDEETIIDSLESDRAMVSMYRKELQKHYSELTALGQKTTLNE